MPPIVGSAGAASAKGFGFTSLQGSPYWVAYSTDNFGSSYAFKIYANSTQGIYYSGNEADACYGPAGGRAGLLNTEGIKQYAKKWVTNFNCVPTGSALNVAGNSSGDVFTTGSGTNQGTFAIKVNSSNTVIYKKTTTSGSLFAYASWDIASDSSGLAIHAGHEGGDLRIVKLASDGASFSFQKRAYLTASPSSARPLKGIALDSSDNIHALASDNSSSNRYVLKFNTDVSSLTWGRAITTFDGNSPNPILCITVDSSGNVFVLGYKDTSPKTQVIVKYNSSGTIQWARQLSINSATLTSITMSNNRCLSTDSSGNVYAILPGTVNGAPNCLVKYDSSGTIQWQRQFMTASGSPPELQPTGLYVTGTDMYASFYTAGSNKPVLWKLPTDGSKTGTYTLTGLSNWAYSYQASSYTDTSCTVVEAASGAWTTANSTYTLTNISSATVFSDDNATFSKVSV